MANKPSFKTNPLHHCMVVHAYYPLGETRVEREAKVLIDGGHDVDIICLRDEGEAPFEKVDGVNVYRMPVQRSKKKGLVTQLLEYLSFFMLVFIKIARLHFQQRYHVVQVHNLPDFLVFSVLIPKLFGAKIILDLHDLMPEFYASRFETDLSSRPVRLVILQEQLSCRFADHVITVSEHWRQALIKRGVRADKCSVVMNVADEEIFAWSPEFAERRSADGRFRLVYHGTIVYRYGLDLAVLAVDRLKEEIPEIELVILGKGDLVEALQEMVKSRNLQEHVIIHHELWPAQALPGLIRTADLGIVPYRNDTFSDGLLPTKLMEYAALGLPCVSARTSAIESYFGDTMTALFEPGDLDALVDCLRELYNSPEQMAKLAKGTQRFNERYNWTKIGSEYGRLVESLAGKTSPALSRSVA